MLEINYNNTLCLSEQFEDLNEFRHQSGGESSIYFDNPKIDSQADPLNNSAKNDNYSLNSCTNDTKLQRIGASANRKSIALKRFAIQRSSSVDTSCISQTEDSDSVEMGSTTERRHRSSASYSHVVARRSKVRGQTAISAATISAASPDLSARRRPMTGIRELSVGGVKPLKRVNSFSAFGPEKVLSETHKKQGQDYLLEIEGKTLSVFGQGALKHLLNWLPETLAENIERIKFHFVSYDTIVPQFAKLREIYPSVEHFHFRANNISVLAQINAIADLQGLTSLHIVPDGNPITENSLWENYAMYRLGHWGLKEVNGKEVGSAYNGRRHNGNDEEYSRTFESLGYLALSCLPQSTLTPLATKLHALQTFCCCSQSSSSEDSGRKNKCSESSDGSDMICNAWDNDPILLDVIGKEALVYGSSRPETGVLPSSEEIASSVLKQGSEMLQKLKNLDKSLDVVLQRAIEDILVDYFCLDNFMKKKLTKLKDVLTPRKLE